MFKSRVHPFILNFQHSAKLSNFLQKVSKSFTRLKNEKTTRDLKDAYACPCDESAMFDKFILPSKGSGMWVWVEEEEEPYLDLVLGYSSLNFGHCHPLIAQAVTDAATQITQIHSFHTKNKLLLSKYLAEAVSQDEDYKVYFDIGGASVVAAALRLCRSHTNKKYVVSFKGGFHGTGYLPATVTDKEILNEEQYGLGDMSDYVVSLPFPDKDGTISTEECLFQLQKVIDEFQPAAVIVEPIQGAAGFIIPQDDFLAKLRQITQETGVLLIIDEIQMGMGRTGYLYSHQPSNITPDIVLLSKSLAGGYYPLSALIARSELFESAPKKGTAFQATFNNNPFGISIALQTLKIAESENWFNNALVQGEKLFERIQFLAESPYICNLRGIGMAFAFNVSEKHNPQLLSSELAKLFTSASLEEKVLLYSCGAKGNAIKIAPPININDEELSIIVEKLKNCLDRFHDSAAVMAGE